jgi:membrane-associated protein
MSLTAIIMSLIYDIPVITTLFTTLLFGEEGVIILGFISGLGLLPLWILFVFGFIGTFLSDLLWFVVGKTVFKEEKARGKMHKRYHIILNYLDKATHNHFLALLFTRFFYFFRLFAIVHLSRKGMPWKKFLLYEIPLILIWLVIFVLIGWFFGNIALVHLHALKHVEHIIIGIILVIAIFLVGKSIIRRLLERKA